MSTIYGNPLLIGGGGVKLNIDYGTNPPSDTTKLWVPRTTTPSSVEAKYEFKFGNEQLAVDNYNYIPVQDVSMYGSCQVGNYIYHYYWQSNAVAYFQRYDMNSGTWEKLEPFTSSTNNSFTRLWQNSMLATEDKIYMFGGRYSSATYMATVFEYDVSTNKITNISNAPSTMAFGVWVKAGDVAYGFACFSNGGYNRVAKYDFTTKEITEVSAEFTFDTTSTLPSSREYYPFDAGNGIFYLLPLEASRTSDSNTPLLKVDLGAKTVTKYLTVAELFPAQTWISGSSTQTLNSFTFKAAGIVQVGSSGYIFGGQCAYSGSVRSSPYVFKIDISSNGLAVSTLDISVLSNATTYKLWRAAGLLDNKIHIIQYYSETTDTTYRNNQTLTLYSPLDNNKLFLQTGFGNNKFNIVNDKKAKVEIAINNAFIGNSENKADETDAYLYNDTAWKNIKTGNQFYAVKGDLISMDLDGNGNKQYRVLKINGSKAMILGMSDISSSWPYNATSKTGTFTNGSTGQLYAGSDLDTYLNTTWYNTLTSAAKAAIVPESRTQYMYQYYDAPNTPNTPTYTYQYQFNWNDSDYDNLNLIDNVLVGSRNVFALDLKDIFDYFGKVCITSNELMELWTNQTSAGGHEWLLSFAVSNRENVYVISGYRGSFISVLPANGFSVRPAFTIDLSKISFTRV